MAKEQSAVSPVWRELFQFDLYKRNQGRITRRVTLAAILLVIAVGCWRLMMELDEQSRSVQYLVPAALLAVGGWLAFRLVNMPRFADFLIAVEAEMTKVSWPTRDVLFRSSFVVMFTIVAFAILLYLYDLIWAQVLTWIGVLA